jgi:hypothetical protein
MNWDFTVKALASAGNRALGAIIAKSKAFGNLDSNSFRKLYNACVKPILEYAAALWGFRRYPSIEAVFNKAARYIINCNRSTPTAAVVAETGWKPPEIQNDKVRTRFWLHLRKTTNSRLLYKVFKVQQQLALQGRLNWALRMQRLFIRINMPHLFDNPTDSAPISLDTRTVCRMVYDKVLAEYTNRWHRTLENDQQGRHGGNKLRTYRLLKANLKGEDYVYRYMNQQHRRVYAQFRIGTAPLKCETDRYVKGKYIEPKDRLCPLCNAGTEDVIHALITCPSHANIRRNLFATVLEYNSDFINLNNVDKFVYLMCHNGLSPLVARSCSEILINRQDILDKTLSLIGQF